MSRQLTKSILCFAGNMNFSVNQRKTLRRVLECQYDLLLSLEDKEIITDEERTIIETADTWYNMNDCFMNIVSRKPEERVFQSFLDSLRETSQSHVANYILGGKLNTLVLNWQIS